MKCKWKPMWNQMFTIQNTWDWLNQANWLDYDSVYWCLKLVCFADWFQFGTLSERVCKTNCDRGLTLQKFLRLLQKLGSLKFFEWRHMKAYEGWIGLMQRYPSSVMPWCRGCNGRTPKSPVACRSSQQVLMRPGRFWIDVHASVDPKDGGYPMGIRIPSVYWILLLIIGGMNGHDGVPHVQTQPEFPQTFAGHEVLDAVAKGRCAVCHSLSFSSEIWCLEGLPVTVSVQKDQKGLRWSKPHRCVKILQVVFFCGALGLEGPCSSSVSGRRCSLATRPLTFKSLQRIQKDHQRITLWLWLT